MQKLVFDWLCIFITLPWGLYYTLFKRVTTRHDQDSNSKFEQNPYTKQTLITIENIIFHCRSVHHHDSIDNSCASLCDHRWTTSHSHRQPSTPIIGIDLPLFLDLAISCRFIISTNPHRQLFCQLVTNFLLADLRLVNSRYAPKDTCPKTVSTVSFAC